MIEARMSWVRGRPRPHAEPAGWWRRNDWSTYVLGARASSPACGACGL